MTEIWLGGFGRVVDGVGGAILEELLMGGVTIVVAGGFGKYGQRKKIIDLEKKKVIGSDQLN